MYQAQKLCRGGQITSDLAAGRALESRTRTQLRSTLASFTSGVGTQLGRGNPESCTCTKLKSTPTSFTSGVSTQLGFHLQLD